MGQRYREIISLETPFSLPRIQQQQQPQQQHGIYSSVQPVFSFVLFTCTF